MGTWVFPDSWDEETDSDESLPDYTADPYRVPGSPDEVDQFLQRASEAIRQNRYIVLSADSNETRGKNDEFRILYGLISEWELKDLLLSIDPSEFCHVKRTEDGRDLYVFCLKRTLYKSLIGDAKVKIYVKHDFPATSQRDVIISLHELEMPIYLPYID